MYNIGIVVIGYNRLHCIKRLLKSLKSASYDGDKVDLIISIDNSGNEKLYEYVEKFEWLVGEKNVIIRPNRLGLKKHIIECGKLTEKYNNLIVLEDDIYVSPYFYNYAKQSIAYYANNDNIAGISLYKHKFNIFASKLFLNEQSEYDTFFLKYAQSWGQIWNKNEWNNFIKWYQEQNDEFLYVNNIPDNLFNWGSQSWLKYHIRYCIENDKYFVYPNISHSTNFSNTGEHATSNSPAYQVELLYGRKGIYNFMPFNKESIKYDAYFERTELNQILGIEEKDLCIDLYNKKRNKENRRYWLTTSVENYKIIKSFGLELKPHEMNIINRIEGNHIFLYDTSKVVQNNINKREHNHHLQLYYYGEYDKQDLSKYVAYKYTESINYRLKQIKDKIRAIYQSFGAIWRKI